MENFATRTVFFVRDAPTALAHYQNALGFKQDWVHEENGRAYVVQVSLHGLEIILNQVEPDTRERAGHGRIFIGLDENQTTALMRHVESMRISCGFVRWGGPTLIIEDQDRNELYFWLAGPEQKKLDAAHPLSEEPHSR